MLRIWTPVGNHNGRLSSPVACGGELIKLMAHCHQSELALLMPFYILRRCQDEAPPRPHASSV